MELPSKFCVKPETERLRAEGREALEQLTVRKLRWLHADTHGFLASSQDPEWNEFYLLRIELIDQILADGTHRQPVEYTLGRQVVTLRVNPAYL